MTKPKTIRVISPAGAVDKLKMQRALRLLSDFGFNVQLGEHALFENGYLSANDEERLADLMDALYDDAVEIVLCTRGGYGSNRLIGQIDYEMLSKVKRKLFIGFSDLTALQLMLYERSGWSTVSGPQLLESLGNENKIDNNDYIVDLLRYNLLQEWEKGFKLESINANENISIEGRLFCGCLSIFVSLLGTKFEPNFENAILILEDVNEPMYKVDRLLWQMRESGCLKHVKGIVLGKYFYQREDISQAVSELFCKDLNDSNIPIWYGLDYGHSTKSIYLPLGFKAHINKNVLTVHDEK